VIVIAALEAPAVVAGLDDVAVMGQPIEQCGGHFCVSEDARPFTEGKMERTQLFDLMGRLSTRLFGNKDQAEVRPGLSELRA
jgi:hypothetical protein